MSFYTVGVTALNAAQLGMTTAGHNIANVNTPGYHRQTVSQATNVALATGAGFIGQGTHVDTIKRVYSQFLDNQVLQAETQSAHLASYQTAIKQIDDILADPSAGLSPALQEFFKAVGDVATNPQSAPSRQSLISAANAMVTRFQTLDQRFAEIRDGVNSQIGDSVASINSYAQQIAKINEQIVLQTSGTGQPANDLFDLRDQLIADLNKEVRTSVLRQDDGTFNVFIGNGQPLVIGQSAFTLSTAPSVQDPTRTEVSYKYGTTDVVLPNGSLTGGRLGGLLEFRQETLDEAQSALGRVAIGLSETFNAQHLLGQDLNGDTGNLFFAQLTPKVLVSKDNAGSGTITAAFAAGASSNLTTSDYRITVTGANSYDLTDLTTGTITTGLTGAALATAIPGVTLTLGGPFTVGDVYDVQPTRYGARDIALASGLNTTTIAAASPIRTARSLTNTGTGAISAGSVSSTASLPPAAPSAVPATITYNAATNQFTGFPATFPVSVTTAAGVTTNFAAGAPVTYQDGATIAFGGISFIVSGSPANGDQFTVQTNAGGVSDNRNMLELAKLQTAKTMVGGTSSYQGAYSQLVSQVGNKSAEVQVTAKAEENLLTQARNSQQTLSGVNLDEEAANLLRYQQAYQAAAKMMQIATTMFDTLLQIGG